MATRRFLKRGAVEHQLGELARMDLRLRGPSDMAFSRTRALRLWLDGAKHALEWVAGGRDTPPLDALEMIEIAIGPEPKRRRRRR